MSNFDIETEIDGIVAKAIEQLSGRLKKAVLRHEKQVIRQCMASQKTTSKPAKVNESSKTSSSSKRPVLSNTSGVSKRIPKREADYGSEESDYSSE